MAIANLFPKHVDNHYRGHAIAKWAFILLAIITIVRSLIHMFAADGGAQSIATIALDTFTPAGADTAVTLFALWGVSQLIIGLLYVIVIWRYRALIPLMYLGMLVEYAMRLAIHFYKPGVATVGTAPGSVGDYLMIPIAIILLWLSLREA